MSDAMHRVHVATIRGAVVVSPPDTGLRQLLRRHLPNVSDDRVDRTSVTFTPSPSTSRKQCWTGGQVRPSQNILRNRGSPVRWSPPIPPVSPGRKPLSVRNNCMIHGHREDPKSFLRVDISSPRPLLGYHAGLRWGKKRQDHYEVRQVSPKHRHIGRARVSGIHPQGLGM